MREGTFSHHTVDIYFAKKGVLTISFCLIFVSCEKELFSRHTVDIYFDKKGVLTIIQYTVGQVINSNWKSHVLCCNVYMCYIREEYNVYKNVVDLFQVYLRGTLKYY